MLVTGQETGKVWNVRLVSGCMGACGGELAWSKLLVVLRQSMAFSAGIDVDGTLRPGVGLE